MTSARKETNIFKSIRVPTSCNDFHDIFTTSGHSILNNLPHPVPTVTSDGNHSYVTLVDIIANILAADVPIDQFDEKTVFGAKLSSQVESCKDESLCKTKAAHHLLIELFPPSDGKVHNIIYVCLKEWSYSKSL